ncbi:MAG: FAD-dependent oxidoreductase [Actinobacteria bacterium]|nr:MAG: FAD-dependent oxidoreductase [Actinomycetota bacterium]
MYDLVIVGGGIAGLCAALAAPEGARIVVIDKGEARAGSSPLAQGGIAAAVGPEDSPDLHAADTIKAGAGICDEQTVRDICAEGPRVIAWLQELGCDFDRSPDGALDLAREGGQTVARSVHWRDATGQEIVRALRRAVQGRNVERVSAPATGFIAIDGTCHGVFTAEERYPAGITLVATGGAGALWGRTTNAQGATADGIVLAMQAGTQVADLEFMQFHPTALDDGSPTQRILLTEALRGEGATLHNERGERFVDELAPRHVVTKAILEQASVTLDCTQILDLERRFPTVVAGARARGFDPVTTPLPVSPAAHYFVGGIAADASGHTSIPGLFAAGECAATGMHGANRMAGNSLLESVVVGRRVGELAALGTSKGRFIHMPLAVARWRPPIVEADPEIAPIMWDDVGPIREETRLHEAIAQLSKLEPTGHTELCLMIARAAAARLESRGVHIRSDYPDQDSAFATRSFDQHHAHAR